MFTGTVLIYSPSSHPPTSGGTIAYSPFLLNDLDASLIACRAAFGPFPADNFDLFVLEFVCRLEELFELLADRLRKIAYVLESLLRMRIPWHGESRSLRSVLPLLFCSIEEHR